MTKKTFSRILFAIMILANIYLIYRINSNTMTIQSYDAGISQRTGVGRLESFWTKYVGGTKDNAVTYDDRNRAEADSNNSMIVLIVLDAVLIGTLYFLNRKPKEKPAPPLTVEERRERRLERKRRR